LVTRNYLYPGVIRDIRRYIDKYNLCQRIKNNIEVLARKLMENKVPERLWMHMIVNLITKLPLVVGKNAILCRVFSYPI